MSLALIGMFLYTVCVTHSPHICWKMEPVSLQSRNCWGQRHRLHHCIPAPCPRRQPGESFFSQCLLKYWTSFQLSKYAENHTLSPVQGKAANAIMNCNCRTIVLGTNVDVYDYCGIKKLRLNIVMNLFSIILMNCKLLGNV